MPPSCAFFKQMFQYPEENWTISLKYVYIIIYSKQIRESVFHLAATACHRGRKHPPPFTIYHPNAKVSQGKANHLLLAVKCWGLHPALWLLNQAGEAGAASTSQLQPKDMSHWGLQPKGSCWRVTAQWYGLLEVFCTTSHSMPGMPWQHQSSGHRWLALFTHFQVSTDCSADI